MLYVADPDAIKVKLVVILDVTRLIQALTGDHDLSFSLPKARSKICCTMLLP